MWFALVAAGLAVIIAAGIYVRRRISGALAELGVGTRVVRAVRWLIVWLLFGFPLIAIVSISVSLALGRETIPRFNGVFAAWLLGVPFIWAVLVVLQSLPWLLVLEVVYAALRGRRAVARTNRWRAIAVLMVIGAFAIYIPVRVIAERDVVRIRRHVVGTGSGAPFRIAFLADLQEDAHTNPEVTSRVISAVNDSMPDVVLSGGDWINSGPDDIAAAARSAGALRSRLGTFSVRGDHEHFAYVDRDRSVAEVEAALAKQGVEMIDNQVRWFEHEGKRIGVAFLGYNYISRAGAEVIETLLAALEEADYSIVVTHQLDRPLAALLENRVDLVLGAHTHGGQINPVVGVVHVSLARLETRFIDGRYRLGTTEVIVTAGIGYSLVPIRYASPGSLELIELRP